MNKTNLIQIRVMDDKKESWRKWASRRGLTLSALVVQSISYFVAAHPVDGYTDEARMSRNLATKEGVGDA